MIGKIAFAALAVTALCGQAAPSAAQGTLRIAMTAADVPTTTGAPNGGFEGIRFLGYSAFEALVLWELRHGDRPAELRPGLAERWEQSPSDPRVWIFHLRRGVRFHDGSEFDADAVVWNLDRYFNPQSPQHDPAGSALVRSRATDLASWRKIDSHTVEIVTPRPLGYFPFFATYILMSSPAQYARVGSWQAFAAAPSGTGPFRIVRFVPRERAELERFPGYWDAERRARLDRLVLLPMPDPATRVSALRAGQVDWIELPPPDAVDPLRRAGFQITTGTYPHLWPWTFDTASAASPFRDARVRRAANYCIERREVVALLNGMAEPAAGFFSTGSPQFGSPANRYTHDPARARALLTEAGYGEGRRVSAKVLISSSGSGQLVPLPMNELLQQQLRACGIDVTFEVVEWNTLLAAFRAGAGAAPSLGAHALNNSLPTSDVSQLARFLAGVNVPPAGVNWGGWRNAAFDSLIARAEASRDAAEIARLAAEAHSIAVDDAPYLYVVHDLNPRAMTARVQGFVSARSWFQDLTNVRLSSP